MDISLNLGYLLFLIYKFFVSLLDFIITPIANVFGFGEYYRGWSFINTILGRSPDSADRAGLFGKGLFEKGGYNLFGGGEDFPTGRYFDVFGNVINDPNWSGDYYNASGDLVGTFSGEGFSFLTNFFNNPYGGESFSEMIFGGWSGFFLFFAILFWSLVWILKEFYIKPLGEQDEILHDTVYSKEKESADSGVKDSKWKSILDGIESEDPGRWKLAILDADVLLDELTVQQGLKGKSLGERLKDAEGKDFKTLQSAWKAHLERNRIAHGGSGYSITKREAKRIIALYGEVFSEFYH